MRAQRFARPAPFIEVQDPARLLGELRIAGEEPTPIAPRLQRVLAQPAPQRRATDLGHQPLGAHGCSQLGERPPGHWHPVPGRPFTGQGLDLDHDAGGKSGLAARLEAAPQGRGRAQAQTVCATY